MDIYTSQKRFDISPFGYSKVTNFRGHEGEPLVQGNLTLNGKKIGTWSEDSWGGPSCIDADLATQALIVKIARERQFPNLDFELEDHQLFYQFSELFVEVAGLDHEYKRLTKGNRLVYKLWEPTSKLAIGDFIQCNYLYTKAGAERVRRDAKEKGKEVIIINEWLEYPFATEAECDVYFKSAFSTKKKPLLIVKVKVGNDIDYEFLKHVPYTEAVESAIKNKYGPSYVQTLNKTWS